MNPPYPLRRLPVLLTVGALILLANVLLLRVFYLDSQRAVQGALSVGLEGGRFLRDPYELAMHLQALESSGLMDCAVAKRELSSGSVTIYDSHFKTECPDTTATWLGRQRELVITAPSGEPWRVGYRALLMPSQAWGLLTANLLLLSCVAVGMGWYRSTLTRRLQEQRQQIEEFGLIRNYFAQVAHDIKAPIAAIAAATSLLGSDAKDEKEVLVTAVERIRGIAHGLLEMKLFKPTSSTHVFIDPRDHVDIFTLVEFLGSVVSEKKALHHNRAGLQFQVNSTVDGNGVVPLDFVNLGRALSNLIENAVESSDMALTVTVNVSSTSRGLVIEVCDTGRGINSKLLPRLGSAGATFGKPGGTGLGLYHAKTYVEAVGGKFKIESKLGHGTTVRLSLPVIRS